MQVPCRQRHDYCHVVVGCNVSFRRYIIFAPLNDISKAKLRHCCINGLARVNPTLLAKVTRELIHQSFRRYVYEFRLDYAKKVLLRSDTHIGSVAKRFGLNSSMIT